MLKIPLFAHHHFWARKGLNILKHSRPQVQWLDLTFDLSITSTSTTAAIIIFLITFLFVTMTLVFKEVQKLLMNEKKLTNPHLNEFINFLLKALSLNMVFVFTLALSVYTGYKLGLFLDDRYESYPTFTLIGTFSGVGLGMATVYLMIQKYLKPSIISVQEGIMDGDPGVNYPEIDVTIEQVRKAVREFSDNLPKGVFRTILVKEDNSIDFKQIAPILGGIPSKDFYMSKETYDLFEESEKKIPKEMDLVQKAVDQYVKDHKQYPMLTFDPHHRVNYYQLLKNHYLRTSPETQFYITEMDGLITHTKPQKKKSFQY